MYQYIRYENKKAWLVANKDHAYAVERMLWYAALQQSVDDINRNGMFQTLMGKYGSVHNYILAHEHVSKSRVTYYATMLLCKAHARLRYM